MEYFFLYVTGVVTFTVLGPTPIGADVVIFGGFISSYTLYEGVLIAVMFPSSYEASMSYVILRVQTTA